MDKKLVGLTKVQVAAGLARFGPNIISDQNKTSPVKIILRQLKNNFVIYLLIVTVIVSFFIQEQITAYTVIGVIFMVVGVGFVQEYRAEKAILALKEMILPVSTVIRDGQEQEISTAELVPQDVVVLRSGERVPADGEILTSQDLTTNEAILTGESGSISKKNGDLVFAGTFVINGKAVIRVGRTGMNTKFGQIVKMVSRSEKELPLMNKVNKIARYMTAAAIIFSTFTGILLLWQAPVLDKTTIVHALVVTIAIMVSAFPEGLPVVLTTCLAVGVAKMAKNNAIVNRMSIVQTLGETTVICTDKTGTITTGEMAVQKTFIPNSADREMLLTTMVICNDGRMGTEQALLEYAKSHGVTRENLRFSVLHEDPFTSEKKFMAVTADYNEQEMIFIKGAPEVVLEKCQITVKEKRLILENNSLLNREAYRTIALAAGTSKNIQFLGLAGLFDPVRPEVGPAIKSCQSAGIRVILITGDHCETALAVAKQIGLGDEVIEGTDLDKLTDEKLKEVLARCNVFARVRPEHKLRLVNILKNMGEVVTMTGDGVNDAPALKEAQVGVAMGKGGTDVSREVADLILKDNNFATLVFAVREGRTIFNNMQKFVSYQLSCNYAELLILFGGVLLAPLFGWQTPVLLALQILFMNLVTDDLPAITFAFNKSSKDVMEERPRRNPDVVNLPLLSYSFFAGFVMTVLVLLAYYLTSSRTVALVTLILLEIINAFNFRSFRYLTLSRSPFTNPYLVLASVVSLLATFAIIYTPVNHIFKTTPINFSSWLLPLFLALIFISVFDLIKLGSRLKR